MAVVYCPVCGQKTQVLVAGAVATCRGKNNSHAVRVMVTKDKLPKEGK